MRTTLLALVLGTATAAATAQTPGFHLVGHAPGTQYGRVWSLSQSGSVAAGSNAPTPTVAFTWTAAGGRDDFGLQSGSPHWTTAQGVSSDGTVVVGHMDVQSIRAFRRVGNGPLENLGVLPGPYTRSFASGVSGDGNIIVGRSEYNPSSTSLVTQAVRWTPQTGMQGLGWLHPFDSRSEATAISRDGSTIVGESNNYGFVWRDGTGMQGLPVLPGSPSTQSSPHAVNSDGTVIVGASSASDGNRRAVRWTSAGIEDLGLLSGYSRTRALAVSDDGLTVGGVAYTPLPDLAFVWTSGGGMTSLVDYLDSHGIGVPQDWNLITIHAISGDGLTFAGEARSTSGVRQGFVATIPAPSGMLVIFSSALFAMRRRRGR
jgi:probable HAF family extracellular repeat protein